MIRTVGEVVKESEFCNFLGFRNNMFYYETDKGFKFPIPLEDAQGITLQAQEKTIYFMRWIRKEIELINNLTSALNESDKQA